MAFSVSCLHLCRAGSDILIIRFPIYTASTNKQSVFTVFFDLTCPHAVLHDSGSGDATLGERAL